MNKTRNMILVSLFTALTAIGAFVRIPLPFIPLTLQIVFVLLSGLILGKKLGALSQLLYLGLGLIGIPIFTEGGGPGYVLKPSFGYLVGFVLAAYLSGLILEKREANIYNSILAALTGLISIYIIGVPYLFFVLNNIAGVTTTFSGAIKIGFLTFLPADLVKVLIVTLITPGISRRLKALQI